MPVWRGNTYRFTVTSANATAGATYTNNGQTFTVTDTIAASTVLFCTGTGAPTASGTLTKTSGTGDATITFSANTAPNTNWGTSTNWRTDGTGAGVPTQASDAVFDDISGDCTVNVVGACRNLNFNSGTGYINTITMNNVINVGSTAALNHSVTLSAGMGINGSSGISTRSNGTTSLRSNGRTWPNTLGINNLQTAINSSAVLLDNWTVQNLQLAGGNVNLTFSGAFNINVLGNLTVTTGNSIRTTAGSIPTVVLAGTGTWSSTNLATQVGVNISINTTGTITIADGVGYGGGAVVAGSNFTYVAGTVTCLGTFYLLFAASGATYTVNLSGDPSISATATSSIGVNFNNLTLSTSALAAPQTMDITGTICVVNELVATGTLTPNKRTVTTRGGTIYCNGSFINNAAFNLSTTLTTFIFQGSGTLTEANTLTSGNWGITGNVIINTAGTYTLGSAFGINKGSTITYTAGSFILTGQILRLNNTTIVGFGSGGITIPTLYYNTTTASATGAAITITDTVPLSITDLVFEGFSGNFQHAFLGNIGFIVTNFNYQQTAGTTTAGFALANSLTYTVTNSFIFRALSAENSGNIMSTINSGVPRTNFILLFGVSQDVYGMGARQIDSSAGQTIWTRKGVLTATTNWNLWTYPKTRFSTFIS